ncbi:MAG: glycosyltransferase family 4 protein [Sandaracinobacter sp.]
MRILVVSQYFWPESFRINELAAALKQRGHDVVVLTSIPNYPEGRVDPGFAADPGAYSRFEGIEIIRVPQMVRGVSRLRLVANYLSFAVSASALGAWRLRGRAFDAVLAFQTSPVTVGLPAGLIARLKRAPMTMWILDCWPETLAAIGVARGQAGQWAAGLLVRAIYAMADLLPGQSAGFRQNVARYGDAAKFRHFPNWVEAEYLAPLPPPDRPAEDPFTIVFAGNIGEAQDFPAILDAADLLRDAPVRFRIVGDGRDLARTRADVSARGLDRLFEFAGRHPASAMPGFFANADALLVSLKADPLFALTLPGKVQTYLAAAKPILAMLDGEGRAVVEQSGAGLAVPAGDPAALAAAVRRMLDMDPEARAGMGQKGRAFAEANYDRDMLVARLEGWLSELMARRRGGRLEN